MMQHVSTCFLHICLLVCITEEVAIRENVEIVCSMTDIFHDHAPVMAFLHSIDMCVGVKGREERNCHLVYLEVYFQ
jgi:hypothetical protein